MRVAQLTCVYPPYGGGIGEVARQYASFLTAEHQVTIITPRYYPAMTFAATPGVTIEARRPLLALGKAAWLVNLNKTLSQYDLVHLHYPWFGVQESLHKLPAGVKLVLTYHMLPQAEGLKGALMKLSQNYSNKRLSNRANLMTVATRDYLETVALPQMGEPNKWQVLPFGVDERFCPGEEPEKLIRKFNIHFGEKVILFIGTLDRAHDFKGVGVLLEAVRQLKSQNWRLLLVGGGGERKRYESQAKAMKLGKQAVFAGYVPTAELPDYYRLATIFVLPSLNQAEAFGLVALEAMATGVAVIASRLPGVRELVRHGETGLTVPPGDGLALAAALETLLASPEERKRLAQNALAKVQANYRWAVVGRKLLDMYGSL